MFYKAKFCCNCGIETEEISRRLAGGPFCRVCAEDFKIQELLPKIAAGGLLIFGLFGIGTCFKPTEKAVQPQIVKNSISGTGKAEKSFVPAETKSAAAVSAPGNLIATASPASAAPRPPNAARDKPAAISAAPPAAAPPIADSETAYFCGALTKKKQPCSRRVKGNVRCWQHKGEKAALPPDKLLAGE